MIIGWDISTSIIGATVLADDGKFVESLFLDLRKLDTDLITKSVAAEPWISRFAVLYGNLDTSHFVEDRLGSFAGGKTMQQTLLKLAAFNATVSYIIWREFGMYDGKHSMRHIHPSTVKGIMRKQGLVVPKGGDKKSLTLQWVSVQEPSFHVVTNKNGNPQPYCFDMADSYIVARSGYTLSCEKKER